MEILLGQGDECSSIRSMLAERGPVGVRNAAGAGRNLPSQSMVLAS